MHKGKRVVVTGVGVISPLGASPCDLWDAVLEGRSAVRRLTHWEANGLPSNLGAEVEAVSRTTPFRDRVMAEAAMDQALSAAQLPAREVGLYWGAGLDSYIATADGPRYRAAGDCFRELASRFGAPRRMVATACASGTQAIGEAFRLIRSGRSEACLAGGSSIMLHPLYIAGFSALQALVPSRELLDDDPAAACRPFDRKRRGLVLADGAGAIVLESLGSAERRGVTPIAEVIGFGMSQDAYDLNRPPEDGHGAELSMRRAFADAGLEPEELGAVNAHGTGTHAGDRAEAAALRRLLGDAWPRTPVSSVKGGLGHAMAAAGAIEAIVALRTAATGVVPPTVNLSVPDEGCELDHVMREPRRTDATTVLSVSFGMGGQNASIVVERFLE